MSLVGDSVHNFIDGLVIGASYLVNIPVGLATTMAVILHEVPQEIGNFAILLHGGFSKNKALLFNFATALTAFLGVFLSLTAPNTQKATGFLIPFAAGNFIYIAGSDLIPELHKEVGFKKNLYQFVSLVFGVLVMMSLLFYE
jgi:zinc and cadmium transporter